jgi:small subunit ribosomal protein S9
MNTINAIGRRKAAVARVTMAPGGGSITINGKAHDEYFTVRHILDRVVEPLQTVEATNTYDIRINVKGGGIKGQAEAISLGISRALVKMDEELKPALKAKGFMTRDARIVERKKAGFRKARKKEQYSKR